MAREWFAARVASTRGSPWCRVHAVSVCAPDYVHVLPFGCRQPGGAASALLRTSCAPPEEQVYIAFVNVDDVFSVSNGLPLSW